MNVSTEAINQLTRIKQKIWIFYVMKLILINFFFLWYFSCSNKEWKIKNRETNSIKWKFRIEFSREIFLLFNKRSNQTGKKKNDFEGLEIVCWIIKMKWVRMNYNQSPDEECSIFLVRYKLLACYTIRRSNSICYFTLFHISYKLRWYVRPSTTLLFEYLYGNEQLQSKRQFQLNHLDYLTDARSTYCDVLFASVQY